MTLKYCTHPYLVGFGHELPSDPHVAYEGTQPIIGCNHLVCSECKAVVRHADGRSLTSHYPPGNLAALYESSDPQSSPLLDSAPRHADSRAYFCRCAWSVAVLGGVQSTALLDDAMWFCGGHPVDPNASIIARPTPIVAPAPPIVAPAPGTAKVVLRDAAGVTHEFATASELRDRLLASYPDAVHFDGQPLIRINRDDAVSAWAWLGKLICMRSDWWPAIGLALEHAARDGGAIAQRAVADVCGGFRESIVLLPWTSKIAAAYPDSVGCFSPATGWGRDGGRLASIIHDQQRFVIDTQSPTVFLVRLGKSETPIRGRLTNEDELRVLLAESARAGRFEYGTEGPWSWLGFELMRRGDWMWDALVRIAATLDAEPEIFALLDWFSEQRDLWRFQHVLAGWRANPPAWSTQGASAPRGWEQDMRKFMWHEPHTLGDIARQALWCAVHQHATTPIIDL